MPGFGVRPSGLWKHITAHADDQRSAFVELDSAVRKNGIDIIGGKLAGSLSR
jgi:hypothetical protein